MNEMDLFNSPYYKVHKYVLMSFGLWPFQSALGKRFTFTLFAVAQFSIILALIAGLKEKWNADLVTKLETNITLITLSSGLAKCIILYVQEKQLKKLYEGIAKDWENLTSEVELDILRTFSLEGRKLVIVTMIYCLPGFLIFAGVTFIPRLFDDRTWKEHSQMYPCYFSQMIINENVYDVQVCLHLIFASIYAGFCYLATSAAYISSVKHMCGLYTIARYRLEHVVKPNKKNSSKELISDTSIFSNLINVIDIHKEAIGGVHLIEQIFSGGLLLYQITLVVCIGLVTFDLKFREGSALNIIRLFMILLGAIMYTFFINSTGQQVIQVCDEIYTAAYYIDWYRISIKARTLVLMIIQRSCKTDHLTAGSFMVLSLENFARILKMSWSFATVLLTTQVPSRYQD